MNDIKIFRQQLKYKLRFPFERVEADDGYRGEYFFVDLPDDGCFHLVNPCPRRCRGCKQKKMKTRLRSRHETCNRRFKQWAILRERYRHNLDFHGSVFGAIAAITQIELRTGEGLFYCNPNYKTKQDATRTRNTAKLAHRMRRERREQRLRGWSIKKYS